MAVTSVAAMVGFYIFCKWITTAFGISFGVGVAVGAWMMTFIFWLVWKFAPESFNGRQEG